MWFQLADSRISCSTSEVESGISLTGKLPVLRIQASRSEALTKALNARTLPITVSGYSQLRLIGAPDNRTDRLFGPKSESPKFSIEISPVNRTIPPLIRTKIDLALRV